MSALSQLRRLAVALPCVSLLYVALYAADPMAQRIPRQGLLVLTNGSLIEGTIALEGDYYKVLLPKGKLQVRIDQVDFFCQSKEEAYVRRRSRKISIPETAEAHLEMARWCMQHELLASAQAEISAARVLDPQHRLLAGTERQLAEAKALAQRMQKASEVMQDSEVVAAAATVETTGRAFGEIPQWARTEFIKRVQPMMVQSCATAGCHLPNTSQQMQIDRTALDGVGNPDLIHRNLASIVAMLDLADPDASRLLVMGAAPHGSEGNQSRPLTPHQLEILRAWVTQLAINEPPREDVEQPQVRQIVVGMTSGSQTHDGGAQTTTAPDPFDPEQFNNAPASDGDSTDSTQPPENPPEETQ